MNKPRTDWQTHVYARTEVEEASPMRKVASVRPRGNGFVKGAHHQASSSPPFPLPPHALTRLRAHPFFYPSVPLIGSGAPSWKAWQITRSALAGALRSCVGHAESW
ncbi:hypothetical protein MRX96_020755 [Rhipicephalus microplus]